MNTGHSVLFRVDSNSSQSYDDTRVAINITGGPLSYRYRFEEMHIHYGLHDQYGSEHSVQGYTFPAELQIFGYNSALYTNFTDSMNRAQGIVGISVLLQVNNVKFTFRSENPHGN